MNSNLCGIVVHAGDAPTDSVKKWLKRQAFCGEVTPPVIEMLPATKDNVPPERNLVLEADCEIDQCVTAVLALSFNEAFPRGGDDRSYLDYSARYFLTLMSLYGLRHVVLAVVVDTDHVDGLDQWRALQDEFEQIARQLDFDQTGMIALCAVDDGALQRVFPQPLSGEQELFPLQKEAACAMRTTGPAGESPPGTIDDPLRWLVIQGNEADPTRVTVRPVSGNIGAKAIPAKTLIVLPGADPLCVSALKPETDGGLDLQLDPAMPLRRGQIITVSDQRPEVADQMAVNLIWSARHPMLPGRPYEARLNGQRTVAQISMLKYRINVQTREHIAASRLEQGEIGYCNLSLAEPFVFDRYDQCRPCGRLSIVDRQTGDVLGTALIVHGLRRATNIHWQALAVDRKARAALKEQQPCCLWFTGLSGSGKSTVASQLEKRLLSLGHHTYTLDGDNVRHGLNRDLGFTDVDRVENIRRIGEVSKLFVDAGLIVMCSFISPFRAERGMVRDLFDNGEFIEIFVDTPLEVCEQRDIKGLYRKARAGQLANFTGIDSPYEPPDSPDIILKAGVLDPVAMVEDILAMLRQRGMV